MSPFMDRDNSLPGKMVVGFVDFFVAPLYATLVRPHSPPPPPPPPLLQVVFVFVVIRLTDSCDRGCL